MRLAKLTLNGFKSFDDRTEFVFDDPVTGIVGPNGCGKSNVVDAVKWVLGERSSKSLRGKEMLDVIFAGSAARKPAGMAAVTLTFDNPVLEGRLWDELQRQRSGTQAVDVVSVDAAAEDAEIDAMAADGGIDRGPLAQRGSVRRGLPIDDDVVEIERRLYRDGGSQYLINGARCRLRDIRDLFLDTGVGADAYSIIEQGRVDAMLLANPQERRSIFEEAAGVARYRQRRVESIRELDRAERNLAVTREQLASTERRLRIVRGQAAKARRFLELDADLRAWRAARALAQHDALTAALEQIYAEMGDVGTQRDAAEASLRTLEAGRQKAEVERHEASQAVRASEDRLAEVRHAAEAARQRLEMATRAARDARARAGTDAGRLRDADASIERAERDRERASDRVAAAAEKLADADRTLDELVERREAAQRAVAAARQAHAEARRRVERITGDHHAARARLDEAHRRSETLDASLRELRGRAETLDAQAREAHTRRDGARTHAGKSRDAAETQAAEVERLDTRARSLGDDRSRHAIEVKRLEERRLRLETRAHALRELLESREGLGEPARRVIEMAGRGEAFHGVLAPLADLVRVPLEHAPQVEAVLGPLLSAIVVPSLDRMPSADELAQLTGRVHFVPLGLAAPTTGPDPAAEALRATGQILPLRHVAEVDREACARLGVDPIVVARLLDTLLHNCWRAASLEAASLLSAGPIPGATIADPEARVLRFPGIVAAGPMGGEDAGGTGLLQRRAEHERLKHELGEATDALARASGTLRDFDAQAAHVSEALSAAQRRLSELSQARIRAEGDADRAADEADRLDRDLAQAASEADAMLADLTSAREQIGQLEEKLGSLESILADERATQDEAEAKAEALETEADATAEALTEARVAASTLGEQLNATRQELTALDSGLERQRAARGEIAAQLAHATELAEAHEQTAADAARTIDEHEADAQRAQEGIAGVRQRAEDARAQAADVERRLDAQRRQSSDIEQRWHALELRHREANIRGEALVQRTADEDGPDLWAELEDYRSILADGVRPVGEQEATEAIDALRSAIARLGSVNTAALDEEGQLEGKNEALAAQVADIDAARQRLETLIERLNDASRTRFSEMLETIRESFAGDNGLFRQLFGGGRAEIRLMPLVREVDGKKVQTDEIDVLESGIEIVARPPGKQPRSISQLSGGEKAMTAVALLLAIFKSKPSCFCVLDEVDAALDDANVDRFCRVIRAFSNTSNFIVVTHHKKTMAMCDRLHGVTMQERGVSTRVGVRFDQVGPDGKLADAAVDGSTTTKRPADDAREEPATEEPERPRLRNALAHLGAAPQEVEAPEADEPALASTT
ncbi:MAG: chromosome segregation protein SMC [Planctomycetota bacterium]